MSDLSISSVNNSLDIYKVRNILISSSLTIGQKAQFVANNSFGMRALLKTYLTNQEFTMLMQRRPLIIYRPIKNAITKRGDKMILAQALGIPESQINLYIEGATDSIKKTGRVEGISDDKTKSIQSYVYRHGSKDQLTTFLDYELSNSSNVPKTLQKTLSYNNGGVADYFARPIHRMSNKTMVELFTTANKHIEKATQEGKLTEMEAIELSGWALKQIYLLQENSKLIKSSRVKNATSAQSVKPV